MFNVLRVSGANTTVEIRLDDLRVLHRLREAYTRGGFATQVLREVLVADLFGNRYATLGTHLRENLAL